MKYFFIGIHQVHNLTIVRSAESIIILMSWWPFIKVECIAKYFTTKQTRNLDSFLHYLGKVCIEKKAWDKVILILHNMINNWLYCSFLVVFQCHINCWNVEIVVFVVSLINSHLEENWKLFGKVTAIFITEKLLHAPTVKGENWDHVCRV